MSIDQTYIPFSQRNGHAPIPPQLNLGEVSVELRRHLDYYICLEIERKSIYSFESRYFEGWKRVASDFYVILLEKSAATFENDANKMSRDINYLVSKYGIGQLFDLVEFFLRHQGCSSELKSDLTNAFVAARCAYRIVEGQIIAIGTAEQGAAVEKALSDTQSNGVAATRAHLIEAGIQLRNSNWAGSVRESIHAVESVARQLAPEASTLGQALSVIEKNNHLHGSLKAAFSALYGYTSDEKGIRHALVYSDAASVDEADALFMLGACASFVSYLLARRI